MPLNNPDTGNFKITYKTLYVGAVITIVVITAFMVIAGVNDIKYEIRDIMAMLTCGIVSTTLIYHAKNLKLNFETNHEKLDFDRNKFEEEKKIKKDEADRSKIKYSFEITNFWFRPDMTKNIELSRQYLLKNKELLASAPIDEIKTSLNSDMEIRQAMACILNYFENICLLIKNGIVDEETIKLCFKTLFVDYYKVLRRYIDEIQRTSSRYLMNYEEIAKKWEKN